MTERQLAAFADTHLWRVPFDTSPRHLAGPGDDRRFTHVLAAAGWTPVSDPLGSEIVLSSPDHRHSLQFEPRSSTSAWWRLRAQSTDTEPGWYAEFGELVPAEILAAVAESLVLPSPSEPQDPLTAVRDAGWVIDARGVANSPDRACRIERLREANSTTAWYVRAHDPYRGPQGPRLWHAMFGARAPEHLVQAFVTALADPAPVQRGMHERTAHPGVTQEPSALSPQQVVDAHTQRIRALRTRARVARRPGPGPRTSPAPVSRPSPLGVSRH
ncbi:DUF317 domain-containing protein [Streptomyces sp. ST2-7A]|uniref:DUF317 domain-containing protein n=1 Tax=Streptomyces sp. ST2-7A TaxID=2907214 RepID=UPI0027E2F064|nr:DUF317 domain-containing protein [Streptomyces sp. ST2-7A]